MKFPTRQRSLRLNLTRANPTAFGQTVRLKGRAEEFVAETTSSQGTALALAAGLWSLSDVYYWLSVEVSEGDPVNGPIYYDLSQLLAEAAEAWEAVATQAQNDIDAANTMIASYIQEIDNLNNVEIPAAEAASTAADSALEDRENEGTEAQATLTDATIAFGIADNARQTWEDQWASSQQELDEIAQWLQQHPYP